MTSVQSLRSKSRTLETKRDVGFTKGVCFSKFYHLQCQVAIAR